MKVLKKKPIALALSLLAVPHLGFAQTTENGAAAKSTVLQEVVVKDAYEREDLPTLAPGRKAAKGARLGILGATAITDAPVHVNAYSRELAEDWGALTLQDVLENDSAVVFTTNKNHLLQNFNLRGQDMGAMDIATNGLYGIAPANSVPIEMFERVEVMRGPNVLLSGMPPNNSVAGSVNMVTKRALSKPIADLTFSYGSKSYGQVHADVGKRFGEDSRLGIRFNGVYGTGEMGADGQKQTRQVGALGLDYMGDGARFSLDVYDSTTEIKNGSPGMFNFIGRGAIVGVGRVLAPPSGDVNMFRGTHGQYDNRGYLARAEFDINANLQTYVAVGGSEAEGQGLLFGTRAFVTGADGTTRGAVYNVHTKSERQTAEAGIIGKFETGSVKHRMQLSWNILKHKEATNNTACNYCYTTNMYDPVTPTFPGAPAAPVYGSAAADTNNQFTSIALADTMSFAQDKVLLTLGARQQTVKQPLDGYKSDRLSPMVAAVVRPWGDKVSLFGNYTEGLEPGTVVGVGYSNEGQTLSPIQTQQKEVGVKLQAGQMTHTFSAFEIDRPSHIESGGALVEAGNRNLTGVEWSAFGKIASKLSLLGGVTHIKSRQEDTGKDSFGVPEWRARIGVDWETPISGLTAGARVIHTSSQWLDSSNKLRLPSWSRFDLNAGYATKFGSTPVHFRAAVENVADKKYWIGTFGDGFAMPGAPRTFRLSAKFSFI